ncbi:hypothetical protein G9P44_006184 [Scheffersomyces stipitis]|nr:hypothetical protein G9P44_006184 [Scheffersomyces stipitis]
MITGRTTNCSISENVSSREFHLLSRSLENQTWIQRGEESSANRGTITLITESTQIIVDEVEPLERRRRWWRVMGRDVRPGQENGTGNRSRPYLNRFTEQFYFSWLPYWVVIDEPLFDPIRERRENSDGAIDSDSDSIASTTNSLFD